MRAHRRVLPIAPLIRTAGPSDGPALVDLVRACWSEYEDCLLDLPAETPRLLAAPATVAGQGGTMLVQCSDAGMEGTVSILPGGDGSWSIRTMYVAPALRGTGLAHALMDRAEAVARAGGATRLSLGSDSKFHRAHAFYEKRSFLRRHPAELLDDRARTIDLPFDKPLQGLSIERLDATAASSAVTRLAAVLTECVAGGASVSFHAPLPPAVARGFWRGVADRVARDEVVLFVAWLDGVLAGTVTLDIDTRPNQRHRADIAKLLVAPAARRRGMAGALMARAEAAAWELGRTLLVLDTQSGSDGERLYRARGWTVAGGIPGYSRDAAGRPEDMTLFYKQRPA